MVTTAFAIVPCSRNTDGSVNFQYKGPDLSTAHWSVHRRMNDGSLSWETDARNEGAAHQAAQSLSKAHNVQVEPYAWAPSALLTACAFALRTRYGLDLYDAGIEAEADLHKQGYVAAEQAIEFAQHVGEKYGMERIDI